MTALIRAEALKLRTVRSPYLFLVGMAAMVALVAAGVTAEAAAGASIHGTAMRMVVAIPGVVAGFFALVLGVLSVAGEFRHRTVVQTYLEAPRRSRVVAAKGAVHAIVGALYGLVAVAVAAATAAGVAATTGTEFPPNAFDVAHIAGVVFVSVLYGMFGVAIGALTRNQVAGVLVAVAGIQMSEQILGVIVPLTYLPTGASQILAGLAPAGEPAWLGALVLIGYVVAATAGALRFTVARDVT